MASEFPYKPSFPILPLEPKLIDEAINEYSKSLDEIASDLDSIVASIYFVKEGDYVKANDPNSLAIAIARIYGALARIYEELEKAKPSFVPNESVYPLLLFRKLCLDGYNDFCNFINMLMIPNSDLAVLIDDFRNVYGQTVRSYGMVPIIPSPLAIGHKTTTAIYADSSILSELGEIRLVHVPRYVGGTYGNENEAPSAFAVATRVQDISGSSNKYFMGYTTKTLLFLYESVLSFEIRNDLYITGDGKIRLVITDDAGGKHIVDTNVSLIDNYIIVSYVDNMFYLISTKGEVLFNLDLENFMVQGKEIDGITSLEFYLAKQVSSDDYVCLRIDWIVMAA